MLKMRFTQRTAAAILLCLGLVVVSVVGTIVYWPALQVLWLHPSDHIITRTQDGWEPSTITIKQGDSITFKSKLKDPFWPASNVHPTHSIYPEFDPKTRIFPPDSWTFTFDKVGSWQFHDHLAPEMQGTITVVSKSGSPKDSLVKTDCERLSGQTKIQCLDQTLQSTLVQKGVKAAFDYFVQLYNSDPEVPQVCHGWAHSLGQADYENYKAGKEIELRPEATFCSYGYFHGFITAMVNDTQSIDGAIAFCDAAVKKVGDQLKGLRGNCIHGIGHGIIGTIELEPENWGNFQRMIHEGIGICEKLYTDQNDQGICVDGMYHELHLNIYNNDYGLSLQAYKDNNDWFYYCKLVQNEDHLESCYYDFITLWPTFFGNDKQAAAQYMVDHMPHLVEFAPRILDTFARSWIEIDITTGHYESDIAACRVLPVSLQDSCMDGLANGFVEHGEPNKQYIAGFAFCRSDILTSSEKASCFVHMVQHLWWAYTPDVFAEACNALPPQEKVDRCADPALQ